MELSEQIARLAGMDRRMFEAHRRMGLNERAAYWAVVGRDGPSSLTSVSEAEPAEQPDRLAQAFVRLGLSESAAKVAAVGRPGSRPALSLADSRAADVVARMDRLQASGVPIDEARKQAIAAHRHAFGLPPLQEAKPAQRDPAVSQLIKATTADVLATLKRKGITK